MARPELIVVDDDPDMAKLVSRIAGAEGFDVCIAANATEFQKLWHQHDASVIVMDLVMPDMDGIELLRWLAARQCRAPIVLMSGYQGRYLQAAEQLAAALGDKIVAKLTKPFRAAELGSVLKGVRPAEAPNGA